MSTARKKKPSFAKYIQWLYKAPDARYARHPTLKFLLLNTKQREQMLGQTSFVLNQGLQEDPLTVEQLKQKLQQGNDSFGKKIASYTANVTGTSAYWWKKRTEVASLVQHKMVVENELPVFFHTGSFAEIHCKGFRILLEKYMQRTSGITLKVDPTKDLNIDNIDADVFRTALLKNLHLCNWYFIQRTEKWFKLVLQEGLGIDDYFIRYEFAKSRGFIHFHSILYSSQFSATFHSLLDYAVRATNMEDLQQCEEVAAKAMEKTLFEAIQLTTLHPSGLSKKKNDYIFTPSMQCSDTWDHGNGHNDGGNPAHWPLPEGKAKNHPLNVIALKAYDIISTGAMFVKDCILLTNRVGLHRCSAYCQRKDRSCREGTNSCRFDFGKLNPERWTDKYSADTRPGEFDSVAEGIPGRNVPELNNKRSITKLQLPRDHPRLNATPLNLLRGWRANLDIQPIIASKSNPPSIDVNLSTEEQKALHEVRASRGYMDKDNITNALIDYVVSYACKAELTMDESLQVYKNLVFSVARNQQDEENAEENPGEECTSTVSAASLAARVGMALLKARTIPGTEADFQNFGLQYTKFSLIPVKVWLSGTRYMSSGDRGRH